jgi:hypothetical protein
MTTFIRKNTLQISASFTPLPGSTAAPSNAEAVLRYLNTSGAVAVDQVTMTLGDNALWTADWDSSNAAPGVVQWMAHCWGGLIAATDGDFTLKANSANMSVA